MKRRTALLFLAAAAFFAALAGSSYAAWLWTNDGPDSAEATPAVYGICNVSVSDLPDGVAAATLPYPAPPDKQNTPAGEAIYLFLHVPLAPEQPWSEQDPVTGTFRDVRSRVVIDAVTGEVVFENYRTPAEETMLKEALATLTVGPWQPVVDAWPRTDTPPKEQPDLAHDPLHAKGEYRAPEDGSGLIAGVTIGDSFSHIRAYTCRSLIVVDAITGEVLRQEVVPLEQAMFDRFLGDVNVGPPKTARQGGSLP